MDFYARALELKQETIAHRRYFHTTAEVGLDMPGSLTVEYYKKYSQVAKNLHFLCQIFRFGMYLFVIVWYT